jgi:flagellar hook-basal body complex protein FliE
MTGTTISNALAAYANVAKALSGAAGPDDGGAAAAAGEDFGALLKKAATASVKAGAESEKQSLLATTGKANISDVVQAVSAAEVTLQMVTAVRDKVVAAYQEVLRMPM